MTIKKPHTPKTLDADESSIVNENFDRLFQVKLESRYFNNSGTIEVRSFQSMETGAFFISATGSPTIAKTVFLAEVRDSIVFAAANAFNPQVAAQVTDISGSSVTITVRLYSGTANFSQAVTASVLVNYLIAGSNP